MSDRWIIEGRDRWGVVQKTCDTYISFSTVMNYSGVGTWSLVCPVNQPIVELLLSPGSGVQFRKSTSNSPVSSGYCTGASIKAGVATFAGVDDLIVLADSLASPQPGTAVPPYSTFEFDVRSGVAETVIKAYVNANIGPSAVTARRWPGLTIAPDLARGSAVTGGPRWTQLIDAVKTLATSGGLGFKCVGLVFDVVAPATRTAKFSVADGTLADVAFTQSVPQATYVYVGGSGAGTSRLIVEGWLGSALAAGWWRRERFVDGGDVSDTTVLVRKGAEALGVVDVDPTKIGLTLDVVPNTLLFGVDYSLGDFVTVVTPWGPEYVRRVEQVAITADQDGVKVVPSLGPLGAEIASTASALAEHNRRLATLERR